MHRKIKLMLLQTCFMLCFSQVYAQEITNAEIDSLVEKTMTICKVPGIAVSIIKDGKIILSKGFGSNSISAPEMVNEKTLFGIASNTKAFTCMALGILIDDKKIKLDDKVIKYIPELKMYDDFVTSQLTIRDLLVHRTGLGFVSGDLMLIPDGNNFTMKDIIFSLRFLKSTYDFRTKFEYNDIMYVIAGEVVSRVSKLSWENFISERILKPLEMNSTYPSYKAIKNTTDIITPHVIVNGKIEKTNRNFSELGNPAGGIYSNLSDLNKWITMLINEGQYANGKLVSKEVFQELFSPQNIIGENQFYGLGWFIMNSKGVKIVTHEGEIQGNYSKMTLIPEKKIGIIVLTNQQSEASIYTISNYIRNRYIGMDRQNLLNRYAESDLQNFEEDKKIEKKLMAELKVNNELKRKENEGKDFEGVYEDNWFGKVKIYNKNNGLVFQSENSPQLFGEMSACGNNKFVVRWMNRNLFADAFVMFSIDKDKKMRMAMEAISPLTDASYDFKDLDFVKRDK